jgi:hypothetical protein
MFCSFGSVDVGYSITDTRNGCDENCSSAEMNVIHPHTKIASLRDTGN